MKLKILLIATTVFMSSFSFAVDTLVLKLKSTPPRASVESGNHLPPRPMPLSAIQIQHLSDVAGYKIQNTRPIPTGAQVIKFAQDLSESQIQSVIQKLKADSDVEYVMENKRMHHMQRPMPNTQ